LLRLPKGGIWSKGVFNCRRTLSGDTGQPLTGIFSL